MFRCQHCGTVTPPRVSAETVVVVTRLQTYPFREDAHRITDCRRHKNPHPAHDDPGGTGSAIVREIRVCPPCKRALQPEPAAPTP